MNNKKCRRCSKILENNSIDDYCTECWNKYHSFNTVSIAIRTISIILTIFGLLLGIYTIIKFDSLLIGFAFIISCLFLGLLTFAIGELIFKLQNIEDNLQDVRN